MGHIVGRGRYARETYPEAPRGGGGAFPRVGYDQPIEKSVQLPPSGPTVTLPRDAAGTPLQVQIPGVTPGNYLEVDYNVTGENASPTSGLSVIPVVSFDGNVTFAPSTSWFIIDNGQGAALMINSYASMRGVVAVLIPPGATTATVQLWYEATLADAAAWVIRGIGSGSPAFNPGTSLKATERLAASVVQAGPSVLVPY
jgi:hypothetical protein